MINEEEILNPENKFEFAVDAYLTKSTGEKIEKKEELDFNNMWIQGIASDSKRDLEGENMNPKGFYTDYFMKVGKITYEHKSQEDPLTAIGEPREAKINQATNEFFVKAILYGSSDLAKKVYEQAWILQNDPNSTRRMQWSVEGKRIVKNKVPVGLLVTHVTLTQNPINYKSTYAEVVKKAFSEGFEMPVEELPGGIDSLKESEYMVYLHSKDKNIYANIKKAEQYCKVLDYCSKFEKTKEFFDVNTFNKLDQFVKLEDVKKSIEYCDIIFHLVDSYPSAIEYFNNNNIVETVNKLIT